MGKTVSVGVEVDLKAKASSMKKLYDDVSNLMANIDPSSSLSKSMNKALGKLRDQVTDFELISNKSFISQGDINSALNLFKRFYRDIGRMNESVQSAGFSSFIHEDSVIQALQKVQNELDNVKSAAEQIKSINIGDAFTMTGKEEKAIKDLQRKFSLNDDNGISIVDARSDAIANLTAKEEEYNKALEKQNALQESQKRIQDKINSRKNAQQTYFGTSDQRRNFNLNQTFEKISALKKNLATDTYEYEFAQIFDSLVIKDKAGLVTDFIPDGKERLNILAGFLGINLSTIKDDAASLHEEVMKSLSSVSNKKFTDTIGSSRLEFSKAGPDYQLAKKAWEVYDGFSIEGELELNKDLKSSQTELAQVQASLPILKGLQDEAESLQNQINELYNTIYGDIDKKVNKQTKSLRDEREKILKNADRATKSGMENTTTLTGEEVSRLAEDVEIDKASQRAQQQAEAFKNNLKQGIRHWMGAQQIMTQLHNAVRSAYSDIKALDKSMTDIAVVTDFSVSDLWGKINEYMAIAQQYGVTTKGVYEVSQLYFQQGLGEADTLALTTETLKMARIAGMEYKDAADGMTVALRGFKMEMEDAARVTDVYSKVAAVTASDSQELIEAMSKTASSAASVGSGFEETTAMLAVMIEATREAPTNIGSAMKSIISRYGEMTKGMSVDAEGEEIVFNKVDAALQSVGVSMKDATGQFREFDEVIYELASKWESLDSLSQRYVATVFAGNRQQSRFLALMSNYDRLVEVTESAENSEDAGLLQYSKTLDSLETKLNSIKTSFQQFYMNILNGDTFKGLLDVVNDILTALNKLPKLETVLGIGGAIISIKKFSNSIVDGLFGVFNKVSRGGSVKDTLFGGTKAGGSAIKNFFKKKIQKDEEVEEKAGQKQIQQKEEKRVEAKELTVESLKLQASDARAYVKETAELQTAVDKDYNKALENQKKEVAQNRVDKYWLNQYKGEAREAEARAKAQRARAEREQQLADKANNQQSKKYHQQQADIANTLAAEEDKKVAKANAKVAKQKKKVIESDKKVAEANKGLIQQTERQKQASKEVEKARRALSKSEHDLQQAESQAKLYNTANAIGTIGADVLSGAGIGLTLAGIKTADSNINLSKKLSAAGSVASVGGQITSLAAQIHPLAGAVAALGTTAVAVGAAIFTTASDLEIAQQEFDKAKAASEEADIERAKKQNRAAVLDSSLASLKNLEEAQWDSAEAQEAFIEAQNNLAASYPELVTAYDSAGNAIVDISNAEAQLAAIRREGAAAALAATEAEIKEKNAELNLNWTKQREGELGLTANADNVAERILISNQRHLIRDDLAPNALAAYNAFIEKYKNSTFDEITYALESDKTYAGLKEIFFGDKYEELIASTAGYGDYESYIEQRNKNFQEAKVLNNQIIGLEKSRIGNVAELALEDFAIASGDYLGYESEFESAIALIKEQLVEQFIGKDGKINAEALGIDSSELYNSETGELSSKAKHAINTRAAQLAESYQKEYEAIEKAGQADEFENFISQAKLGKFSQDYIKTQLSEYANKESEFYEAYWNSIQNSLEEQRSLFTNFISADRIVNIPAEIKNIQNELPEYLLTNVRSTIKKLESQVEDGKISNDQAAKFAETYSNFINSIYNAEGLKDAEKDKLYNLLSEADLFSVFGIYNFVDILKEEGYGNLIDKSTIPDLISNTSINVVTEYQNLQDKIISNLEQLSEALSQASDGMEFSEALSMAQKMGVSIAEFDQKDGKFYFDDTDKIIATYGEKYSEIRESLFGKESVFSKMLEASKGIESQGTAEETISYWKKQGSNDIKNILTQYGSQYIEWEKDNKGKSLTDFLTQYIQAEADAFDEQVAQYEAWLKENQKSLQKQQYIEAQNLFTKGLTGYSLEDLYTISQKLGINTDEYFSEQADGTYSTTLDNIKEMLGNTRADIIFDLITSLEKDVESALESIGSLGEEVGRGEEIKASDIQSVFGDQVKLTEWRANTLKYWLGQDNKEIFAKLLSKYSDGKISFEEGQQFFDEYKLGFSREASNFTKTLLENQLKFVTGELTKTEIENWSNIGDNAQLKEELLKLPEGIDDWATATVEQRMNKISSLLMSDKSLTVSERRTQLESYWEDELKKTEDYQRIDENRRKEEIQKLIRETGGKDLTESELAQIRAIYGQSIEAIATETGWDISDDLSSELQDDQTRFYADLAQNAVDGAKDILSAMAEGTLTGAQIQDYFEELDIDIDYTTAENLANGTLEGLLESIKTSLASSNIDVSDKMDEIMAVVIDAILNSISSGISSLGSGLEGTLDAADYQSLAKKYGLTGVGTSKSSKGIRLGAVDQQKLISRMFLDAQNAGLENDFGEQIWEVYRDSQEDAIDGYTAIEKEIARVKGEHKELTGEALAYVEALQQARHAAMFDEDSVEFAFMEQDSVDGLTKSFDKFVDNVDKAKDAISGLKTSKTMGYNDFFNILDTISKSGNWRTVAKNMGLAQEFVDDYNHFATSVVSASEEIGKIDAKGLAKVGLDVSTAAKGMAEGMADGLKETAKSQIKYLSGLEQMLMALAALEAVGDIDLSLGIDINGDNIEDGNDSIDQLADNWARILAMPDTKKIEIQAAVENKLLEMGNAGLNNLFEQLGLGDNFYKAVFDEDGFNIYDMEEVKLADFWGTISKKIADANLTQGQAETVALGMYEKLSSLMKYDEKTGKFGFADDYMEEMLAYVNGYDYSNVKESLNTAIRNKLGSEGTGAYELETSGMVMKLSDGNIVIEGISEESFKENKKTIMEDISKWLGQTVTDIELGENGKINVFGENGLIDTSGAKKLNTDFTTAAEAASTLQTAITQISTVASTFQASSGFQSLADQLNAAAEAAGKLINSLGGNGETTLPDTSAIEAELAAALAIYESMERDMTHGVIPMNYDELDAAQDRVIELQGQLDALKAPSSIATGLIAELGSAVEIANQLSSALANNNGTPLEVNFNVDEANDNVTVLIANLLQLNAVFKPTIEIEDKASSVLESIIQLIANISSKTVTITTVHKDVYATVSSSGNGGISDKGGKDDGGPGPFAGTMNGLAFADGSLGRLHSGAVLANKALVGELGPELAVYDGQYHMLGANGAEFVDLPSDAIIFNHLQTQGILRGQMNIRGTAMAEGNVSGPAFAGGGIGAALSAVRRAKSVWQGLLNSLSAADLMKGGGGGGGGGDESLKAHIADLQEWYNLSRQIADIEGQINVLLAKRKNITDGHEYLRNLRETQRLLDDQVNTQQDLLRFQELQLQRQAEHINNNKIWSQFLEVDENGLLQYKKGNETNGGKGALEVLSQMNEMSGEEQLAFVQSLGWSYTNTDGEELEDAELVAKFYEELQKQIDDYDALRDTVQETEGTLADLEEQINEIEKEIRDNEIDLSKEIYDIIVDSWKENIENLKEQNDLIKEANEAYANGIQEAIDVERQMYDQNTAISDREQLQRQLALMRRSGGSASEIADLEKQLDDMFKEEYFTNQEKQLETIQKANERQAELLDQQVKIQEDLLEYQQENGVIWNKVYEVLSGTDAEIMDFMQGNKTDFFEQSALQQEDMLTEWAKKIGVYTEERQRQNYATEAGKTFSDVWNNETGRGLQDAYNRADSAQQEKWKREYNDTYASKMLEGKSHEEALAFAQEEFYEHIRNWIKAEEDKKKQQQQTTTSSSEGSGTSERNPNQRWKASGRYGNSQGDRTDVAYGRTKEEALRNLPHPRSFYNISYGAYQRYAKGGIIDYTGPAWVDGSKSKPERILSAEQNRILEEGLAMNAGRSDKLREMFSNFAENLGASVRASISNITNRANSSAITIQPGAVQLNIEQLNDKYDVDELFNDVADRLYSIAARASGRGVNRR